MMPTTNRFLVRLLLVSACSLAACGGSGTGKAVREGVSAQMLTIQSPIAKCYEEALTRSRQLRGQMILSFRIEPKTGKFQEARVASSELPDPQLERCVLAEVSKLVLPKPQKTVVGIDTYPLRFSPLDE